MNSKIIKSKSAQETLMIGEKIASKLQGNEIILLFGELGSGKTTLSQGLIKGLGYEGWPRSPSFVIVKEYKVKYKIQHMDFYRLDDLASLLSCIGDLMFEFTGIGFLAVNHLLFEGTILSKKYKMSTCLN